MPMGKLSRLAELLFATAPLCDFARTVAELESVLTRICGTAPHLTWDCDDIASFDMPGVRILLSHSESPYPGFATRLVVSVGPSPLAPRPGQAPLVHAAICARLVSRLEERCSPAEIRYSNVRGVVTAETIDLLSEGRTPEDRRPERPGIFTPSIGTDEDGQIALRNLRAALHPYGPGADFPAAWTRVANNMVDLAAAMAILPATALQFASTWYRTANR